MGAWGFGFKDNDDYCDFSPEILGGIVPGAIKAIRDRQANEYYTPEVGRVMALATVSVVQASPVDGFKREDIEALQKLIKEVRDEWVKIIKPGFKDDPDSIAEDEFDDALAYLAKIREDSCAFSSEGLVDSEESHIE